MKAKTKKTLTTEGKASKARASKEDPMVTTTTTQGKGERKLARTPSLPKYKVLQEMKRLADHEHQLIDEIKDTDPKVASVLCKELRLLADLGVQLESGTLAEAAAKHALDTMNANSALSERLRRRPLPGPTVSIEPTTENGNGKAEHTEEA